MITNKIKQDMDYKEKYELTLKKAKGVYNSAKSDKENGVSDKVTEYTIQLLETIFPELKESEDEIMRKNIKIALMSMEDNLSDFYSTHYTSQKELLAWLENQGKQDNNEDSNILQRFSFYSYKDEPNILYLSGLYVNEECRNKGIGTKILTIADEVAARMNCNIIRLKTEIGSNAEWLYRRNGYNTLIREGNQVWLEKHIEKKSQGKSIIEAWKDMRFEFHEQVDGDDITRMFSLIDIDEIVEKIAEKQGEQKPVWSENDKKMLNQIISIIEDADDNLVRPENISIYINWLKSKTQSQLKWKPSELQIEALESATANCAYSEYEDCLKELIKKLKQL